MVSSHSWEETWAKKSGDTWVAWGYLDAQCVVVLFAVALIQTHFSQTSGPYLRSCELLWICVFYVCLWCVICVFLTWRVILSADQSGDRQDMRWPSWPELINIQPRYHRLCQALVWRWQTNMLIYATLLKTYASVISRNWVISVL